MPKPRLAKVAGLGLLFLLLLSSSDAVALTLPNPPDRSAPANNQNGPLLSGNEQPFTGGVLLVKDGSSDQLTSTNELVAQFYCTGGSYIVTKQYPTEIGESISGPISNDQAAGIIQAMNSVRPPKTVGLSVKVVGFAFGSNMRYNLTGITHNVTTYSVWITTQSSPAVEQRVGYIVVSVPTELQIGHSQPSEAPDCTGYSGTLPYSRLGDAFTPDPLAWLYKPLIPTTTPPDDGVAPIITYGAVRVLSGGGVAGAARIRPGENATFLLPPGTYSAVADVALFGVPFSVGTGTHSSPEGASAAQLTVSLASVEYIWYGLETLAVIILVAAIWVVAKKLKILAVMSQASERRSGALTGGGTRSLRELQGELLSRFKITRLPPHR